MRIPISDAQVLGRLIRAVRKSQSLRQDDTAASIGVSENLLAKLEHGGDTVQLGKTLKVLRELGIELSAEVPDLPERYMAAMVSSREK